MTMPWPDAGASDRRWSSARVCSPRWSRLARACEMRGVRSARADSYCFSAVCSAAVPCCGGGSGSASAGSERDRLAQAARRSESRRGARPRPPSCPPSVAKLHEAVLLHEARSPDHRLPRRLESRSSRASRVAPPSPPRLATLPVRVRAREGVESRRTCFLMDPQKLEKPETTLWTSLSSPSDLVAVESGESSWAVAVGVGAVDELGESAAGLSWRCIGVWERGVSEGVGANPPSDLLRERARVSHLRAGRRDCGKAGRTPCWRTCFCARWRDVVERRRRRRRSSLPAHLLQTRSSRCWELLSCSRYSDTALQCAAHRPFRRRGSPARPPCRAPCCALIPLASCAGRSAAEIHPCLVPCDTSSRRCALL